MREQIKGFAERLLSTKLVTLVIMWVAGYYSFMQARMVDSQFVTLTLGIGGLIVAASYVDKKTEKKNLFDEVKNV